MRYNRSTRRGMTSMLAMLYLIMLSTLAVGFYAATNTAVQLAKNEGHARQAMLSAESGLEFMRYTMGNVEIPHFTPNDQMWSGLCQQIASQLDKTANVGGKPVTPPAAGATSWTLPTLKLPDGASCVVTISPNAKNSELIDVTVSGVESGDADEALRRKIRLTFGKTPRASEIFDYGVASKSAISMGGKAKIQGAAGNAARGSVLSATAGSVPLTMSGNPAISGDFSFTNANGNPGFGSGTIAGYSPTSSEFLNHVHRGVREPEFPTIDTASYEKYVPSSTAPPGGRVITGSQSNGTLTNVRIKANANANFSGKTILKGVIYIETPNQIKFTGDVDIQGVIVVQNNPTGSTSTNSIWFGGNVKHVGVETPLADGGLDPKDPAFAGLAQLGGSFLLAPKFTLTMRGNSNSIGGTIVAGKIDLGGTAGGTVKGTVINLEDTLVDMNGTSQLTIASSGTSNYPTGVTFGTHFTPNPGSYLELQ